MDDDEDLEHTPWTDEGAARLLAAADAVAAAVAEHARALVVVRSDDDMMKVFSASDELLPVLVAYADAQFDFTGNGFPFGALEVEDEEDTDEEDADEEDADDVISVLSRHDYVVVDEESVLRAGREGYLRVYPDDSSQDADRDVTHIGRALYQIAHTSGWKSLGDVDGLSQTGGSTIVIRQDWALTGNPNEWPDDLFEMEGELVYRQNDVFGVRPEGL